VPIALKSESLKILEPSGHIPTHVQGLLYLVLNVVEEPNILHCVFIYFIIYSVSSSAKLYGRPRVLTPGALCATTAKIQVKSSENRPKV
jgi:hypothetical protein